MMYVPILKNRMFENKLIKEKGHLFENEIIMPMIEIISLRQGKKLYDLPELIYQYDNQINSKYFIDLFAFDPDEYKPFDIDGVEFAFEMNDEKKYVYDDVLEELNCSDKIIPVISVKKARRFLTNERLQKVIKKLQSFKSAIAIRLDVNMFNARFRLIDDLLRPSDFLMLDVKDKSMDSYALEIEEIKTSVNLYKRIFIHAPRPKNANNGDYLVAGHTDLIDTKINTDYANEGFDGYGDYAGLKDEFPSSGGNGQGAALAIFYDRNKSKYFTILDPMIENNYHEILQKGVKGYQDIISLLFTKYRSLLDNDGKCLAYEYIQTELIDKNKTGSWGTWKYITILRTISEIKKSTENYL